MVKTVLEAFEDTPIVNENIDYIYMSSNAFITVFSDYFEGYSIIKNKPLKISTQTKIKMLQEVIDMMDIDYNIIDEIGRKKFIIEPSCNGNSDGKFMFKDSDYKIVIYDAQDITSIPISIHEISHYLDYKSDYANREIVDYFTETISYTTEVLSIFCIIKKESKYKKDLLVFLNNMYYRLLVLVKKLLPLLKIMIVQKEYGTINRTNFKSIWGCRESFEFYLYYMELIEQESFNLLKAMSYAIAPNNSVILLREKGLIENLRNKISGSSFLECMRLLQVEDNKTFFKDFTTSLKNIT